MQPARRQLLFTQPVTTRDIRTRLFAISSEPFPSLKVLKTHWHLDREWVLLLQSFSRCVQPAITLLPKASCMAERLHSSMAHANDWVLMSLSLMDLSQAHLQQQ
jgi:hypothetical protein